MARSKIAYSAKAGPYGPALLLSGGSLVLSQFLFEPRMYFRARLSQSPRWLSALLALFLCVVLQALAFTIIVNKTVHNIEELFEKLDLRPPFSSGLAYAFGVYSSAFYVVLWLFATAFLVCVDILIGKIESYQRLLELTAVSFYSQVPYLLLIIVAAILYTPPDLPAPIGKSVEDIHLLLHDYRYSVANAPAMLVIRNLSYLFQAWLIGLMVVAYGAFADKSRRIVALLWVIMYLLFVIGGSLV